MATAKFHYDDFRQRLIKAGLGSEVVFVETDYDEKTSIRVKMEVTTKPYNHANCLALMGLIAHFQNRLWAKDWSYMYIMQSHHAVTFTDGDDEKPYLIIDSEDGEIFKRTDLVGCRQWILNKFENGDDLDGYKLISEEEYKTKYPTSE